MNNPLDISRPSGFNPNEQLFSPSYAGGATVKGENMGDGQLKAVGVRSLVFNPGEMEYDIAYDYRQDLDGDGKPENFIIRERNSFSYGKSLFVGWRDILSGKSGQITEGTVLERHAKVTVTLVTPDFSMHVRTFDFPAEFLPSQTDSVAAEGVFRGAFLTQKDGKPALAFEYKDIQNDGGKLIVNSGRHYIDVADLMD